MRPIDRGQIVQHGGEAGTDHVPRQQVVLGGPAPQRVDQLGKIMDLKGVQSVFGDADPVVADPE